MSIVDRIQYFLGTSDAYKVFFKGGFVMVASAVIALGQIGPDLYSKDLEAHKLKFEAEFAMKSPISGSTDCSSAGANEVSCRLAQHHLKTLDSTLGLWETYMRLTLFSGSVLLAVGTIGFLMPLFGKPKPSRA